METSSFIALLTLVRERPDAEAYFLSCTNIQAVLVIDALGSELGAPVITSNQAMRWHALRKGGVPDAWTNCGALPREHGAFPDDVSPSATAARIAIVVRRASITAASDVVQKRRYGRRHGCSSMDIKRIAASDCATAPHRW